jgi:glycosyltransferase involved in cell wall biosynthesis
LAGEAQEDAGRKLVERIRHRFSGESWWPKVHWQGWVNEPRQFLGTLDLLVVPSSEFDPFPTVLLEAAQVGLPVLAANVGGVSEIVAEGETGLLFDPDDPRSAAVKLARLMAESKLLDQMSQRAISKANQEFSVGKMVAEYRKVYSTVLN